jgi:DNA-binding beta-propeller fold protein YncE
MTGWIRRVVAAGAAAAILAAGSAASAQVPNYELWVVDQANVANGGDILYVYTPGAWTEARELVHLSERAAGVGDGPGMRPHLLAFNSTQSHALLANVASGHVYVIRSSDRAIVASIDVGEQAHGAMASPDDRWILAANQNGKRLARIRADFANEQFTYEPDADLDLKALEDESNPDNAPICPVMYMGTGGKAYVTMRGGGLYVVDTLASPMAVMRAYPKEQIGPSGCGGLIGASGDRVYINSGSASGGSVYTLDAATDEIVGSLSTSPYGTDAHGMTLVGGRYLWIANRGDGDNIVVVDTRTSEVVGTIADVGAAPDLMELSPGGDLLFVTLRGPRALTGGPTAIGTTPGVAVLSVENGGASGRRAAFIPIGSQDESSHADPHALAIRRLGTGPR